MPDALPLLRAALAGRYEFVAGEGRSDPSIGTGGMASVYLARDIERGRLVAVKVLRPELALSIGGERFLREIAIAARLTHPHILPLHDSGEVRRPGLPPVLYYVMPYVEGQSLRDRLRREGPLPLGDAVKIARDVAGALAYAHTQGVIHRDIKPENILLEAGEPVVADFGLARTAIPDGEPVSEPGLTLGTPAYMSPEQTAGGVVDGRSDIYSLGCVFYEMLVGEPPFTGPSAQVIHARHRSEPPRPVGTVRPVGPGVLAVLDQALAKLPADRFQRADDLVEALSAPSLSTPGSGSAPASRFRWPLALLLLVGVPLAGATLWGRLHRPLPGDPAPLLLSDLATDSATAEIAPAVGDLVATELAGSRRLAVVPRSSVRAALAEAGLPETARVTGDLARQVASRLSVRGVVGGSLRRAGPGELLFTLEITDAETGRRIASEAAGFSDTTLVREVGAVVRRVRGELGERRADLAANRPLYQIATPSFAAFRKYRSAMDVAARGDLGASNRLLHEAIALDTGFAAAWGALGINYISERDIDSARLALDRALARQDRLSDAQRYRLEGDAAYALRHDLAGAVRWYDLYIREVPTSIGGRINRGLFLMALGRTAEALADFEAAVARERGGDGAAQLQLVDQLITLYTLGRRDDARAVLPRLRGPVAAFGRLLDLAEDDRWAAAESLATALRSDPAAPSWARMQAVGTLASIAAAEGRAGEADTILRAASDSSHGAESRWYGQARLLLAAGRGTRPGALPAGLAEDTTIGGRGLRARWLALRGDTLAARRVLDTLAREPVEEVRWIGAAPAMAEAAIAAQRGGWAEVVARLGPAAARGEPDNTAPDRPGTLALRWEVAAAWHALGRDDSAAVLWRALVDPVGLPAAQVALRGLVVPSARRMLAAAHP